MKRWNEGRAVAAAAVMSASALCGVLGCARLMQYSPFDIQLPDPLTSAQAAVVPNMTAPNAAEGRPLFLMNCAHCHGQDAHGDEGPDLHNLHKSNARIHQVITTGIKGEMPSFGKKLGEEDIQALTAYLRTLGS